MRFFGRTPERMAHLLGAFADRGDGGDGAQRFFAAIERVGEDEVRSVLELLIAAAPEVVEVPGHRVRP